MQKRDYLVSAGEISKAIRFGQTRRVAYSAAAANKLRRESTVSYESYCAADCGEPASLRFTGFAHWCNRPWLVILENAPENR